LASRAEPNLASQRTPHRSRAQRQAPDQRSYQRAMLWLLRVLTDESRRVTGMVERGARRTEFQMHVDRARLQLRAERHAFGITGKVSNGPPSVIRRYP
jgi:hypothetical protein